MNQVELMRKWISGDFDGNTKPVGNLYICMDGWGGMLMYGRQQIGYRDVACNDDGSEWHTHAIAVAKDIYLPTAEHRAANKLREVLDDMGYRFKGEEAELEIEFPHRRQEAMMQVYRHPDATPTLAERLEEAQRYQPSDVRYIAVSAEGLVLEVSPDADLETLQTIVGGYIENVSCLDNGLTRLYVNEEGLLLGLPFNPVATILAGREIVGDVVITGPVDEEGGDGYINYKLASALV